MAALDKEHEHSSDTAQVAWPDDLTNSITVTDISKTINLLDTLQNLLLGTPELFCFTATQ